MHHKLEFDDSDAPKSAHLEPFEVNNADFADFDAMEVRIHTASLLEQQTPPETVMELGLLLQKLTFQMRLLPEGSVEWGKVCVPSTQYH